MATKQELYDEALIEIGDRTYLTSESKEAVRTLDKVYDQVIAECLAEGSWNFAMESIKVDADTGIEPSFGYSEVFAKPTDWVRTHAISTDEMFYYPLNDFFDENETWSAGTTPIYVRYVSNDTGLGLELSKWTANFKRYVVLELALRVVRRLTQEYPEELVFLRDKARRRAKNHDAMDEGARFKPYGSWTISRYGRSAGRDRGLRNKFTGS